MQYESLLADRTRLMEASVIREILKVASSPGMISLAGGLPAAESFPLELMEELLGSVLGKYGGLIMSGSQSLLDGMGKILISPGDVVAVEAPTYLGALQAFNPYEPRYVEIATDDDGLVPDSL